MAEITWLTNGMADSGDAQAELPAETVLGALPSRRTFYEFS